MPSGEELVELIRAVARTSDRSAFAALFKHLAPRIKAYLIRAGTSRELAEELAQETMVTVWRKAAAFDPARAQLSTWVFTIARNLRVDALRRQHGGGRVEEAAGAESSPERDAPTEAAHDTPGPEEQLDGARREAAVRRALGHLTPEQLEIVWLSFYEEQSHARIATDLNLPLGTVKSRIRLAVSHMRRVLQEVQP